ncbi:MAG: AbrB/MazE/SpoVT family DNA-binding domain-containing protein [Smithella sp.]
MPLVKVKRHFQVTIPSNMCRMFGIGVGDLLEIVKQHNEIVLKPVKVVQPGQEYFYSKEWQQDEAKADKDIAKGDVFGPFDNIKKGLKALKTAKK